jgi:predicted transcriptional regulator
MEATDLFFSSKTYRKYIAENTEIDKKSWQEIYEMLKKELKR